MNDNGNTSDINPEVNLDDILKENTSEQMNKGVKESGIESEEEGNDRKADEEEYDMLDDEQAKEHEKEQKKKKKEQSEEKPSFSQRFLAFLKKLPVYIMGAAVGIVSLARQLVRTMLFGPDYARRTENDWDEKINDLKKANEIKAQNKEAQEQKEKGRDPVSQEKDEVSKDEHGTQQEGGEREEEVSEEGQAAGEGGETVPEIKDETELENEEEAKDEEPEEGQEGQEESYEEGEKEEETSNKKQPENTSNGKFSVNAMTKEDVESLISTPEAKHTFADLEEGGVMLHFSDDMETFNICSTDGENISRPIHVSNFLKGDISELAVACKDIDYQMLSGDEYKGMDDAQYIVAAASISTFFRSENLAHYQASDVYKQLRNSESLAYLNNPETQDGKKESIINVKGVKMPDSQITQYVANSVTFQMGYSGDIAELRQEEGDENPSIMVNAEGLGLAIQNLSEDGYASAIMQSIEDNVQFPENLLLSEIELEKISAFQEYLESKECYEELAQNTILKLRDMSEKINIIVEDMKYGLSFEQVKEYEEMMKDIIDEMVVSDIVNTTATYKKESKENLSLSGQDEEKNFSGQLVGNGEDGNNLNLNNNEQDLDL